MARYAILPLLPSALADPVATPGTAVYDVLPFLTYSMGPLPAPGGEYPAVVTLSELMNLWYQTKAWRITGSAVVDRTVGPDTTRLTMAVDTILIGPEDTAPADEIASLKAPFSGHDGKQFFKIVENVITESGPGAADDPYGDCEVALGFCGLGDSEAQCYFRDTFPVLGGEWMPHVTLALSVVGGDGLVAVRNFSLPPTDPALTETPAAGGGAFTASHNGASRTVTATAYLEHGAGPVYAFVSAAFTIAPADWWPLLGAPDGEPLVDHATGAVIDGRNRFQQSNPPDGVSP